jgi:adenosylcobinamide kinase / adenosylcobinamide-phosphate guanylyltransferase
MRELILGGQKSGKSRLAEERARAWLSQSPSHQVVLIATGLAHDHEMSERIERHQADRKQRLPQLLCIEEPWHLGAALLANSDSQTLVVIDCITMWLTNLLMPVADDFSDKKRQFPHVPRAKFAIESIANFHAALGACSGPVVMVSNEIGLGVIPLGQGVRHFVDELGKLNQAIAAQCTRVTLMAAGCALTMKETS